VKAKRPETPRIVGRIRTVAADNELENRPGSVGDHIADDRSQRPAFVVLALGQQRNAIRRSHCRQENPRAAQWLDDLRDSIRVPGPMSQDVLADLLVERGGDGKHAEDAKSRPLRGGRNRWRGASADPISSCQPGSNQLRDKQDRIHRVKDVVGRSRCGPLRRRAP
jgi:hypothetical protein